MRNSSYLQEYCDRKAILRRKRIYRLAHPKSVRRYLPFGYDDSYLSSIPGIIFSFSYSVSQIIAVRYGMRAKLSYNSWGYGQIVSLLLLCIPFMAAGGSMSGQSHPVLP